MTDNNLYNGIFYCVNCDKSKHITCIYNGEYCECGEFKFISNIDCDIAKTIKELEDIK